MQPTLIFLHTAPANVDTFDTLAKELAPDIPRRHVVDESLLQEALQLGEITPQLAKLVSDTIFEAAEGGARVLLCTCSTIGGCAEDVNQLTDSTVIRVDRPMAAAILIGMGFTADEAMKLISLRRKAADPYKFYIRWRIRIFETWWRGFRRTAG